MTKEEQYARWPWLERKELSPDPVMSVKDYYCDLEAYTGMTQDSYEKQCLTPVRSQEGFFHDHKYGTVVYKFKYSKGYFFVTAEFKGGKYLRRASAADPDLAPAAKKAGTVKVQK